jgi:hypothetical protein
MSETPAAAGCPPVLVGQERAVQMCLRMLRRGRVAHALLVVGAAGSGRGRLAEVLACACVCARPQATGLPCERCPPCRLVLGGNHADVHWIGHAGRLGIDEVRAIVHATALAPRDARCSVFVLEACERLTGPAAGALLKVLEEPAGPVLFALLAEHPDQLEPTLRSRCVEVRLGPVPPATIEAWLEQVAPTAPPARRRVAAQASRGLPGLALRLCADVEAAEPEGSDVLVVRGLLADTPGEIVACAAELAQAACPPERVLAILRDAWVQASGLRGSLSAHCGLDAEALAALARAWPVERWAASGPAVAQAQSAQEAHVQAALNWQVLLARLRRLRTAC